MMKRNGYNVLLLHFNNSTKINTHLITWARIYRRIHGSTWRRLDGTEEVLKGEKGVVR